MLPGKPIPLTWDDIKSNLVNGLMIDAEWMTEAEDSMSWWPWFLRQDVFVANRQPVVNGDNLDTWIRITASIDLGISLSDIELLDELLNINWDFPFGCFFLEDGILKVECSIDFGATSRVMFPVFQELVLLQATYAHQIAQDLEERELLSVSRTPHNQTGLRENPDELLMVYWDSEKDIDEEVSLDSVRNVLRSQIREYLLEAGASIGTELDDVSFFNYEQGEICVGIHDESLVARKCGPGLVVQSLIALLENEVTPDDLNRWNMAVTDPFFPVSHFFSLIQFETELGFVVRAQTYIDLRLLDLGGSLENALTRCLSIIEHFRASAFVFRRTWEERNP